MADDKLSLMRKIICANIIFWLFTVIHTIFTIILLFIENINDVVYPLVVLSIIQLLHSVLVTIWSKNKKFEIYCICIIIQVIYILIIFKEKHINKN